MERRLAASDSPLSDSLMLTHHSPVLSLSEPMLDTLPPPTLPVDLPVDDGPLSSTVLQSIPDVVVVAREYPEELKPGLCEIEPNSIHVNFVTEESMCDLEDCQKFYLRFTKDETLKKGKYTITSSHVNYKQLPDDEEFKLEITYHRKIEAFRALGHVLKVVIMLDGSGDVEELVSYSEECQFDTVGTMLDCSRNAVLTLPSIFFLLRTSALLGLNTFQLYTEDTYEIPTEPLFGYLRGRYTQEELKLVDDYADMFGVEVFPCIQTLGHLGQVLQWPVYSGIRDTMEVLLPEHEETYTFISKMIDAATRPFRSNRIHIGMDEAHGVGEGRYKQIFGSKDSTMVFLSHLKRVVGICKERGLNVMVWSDMLFTLAAKNSSLQTYYEQTAPMDLLPGIPPDIDLVYWDYYHTDADVYTRKIEQHREMNFEPWVAGGIWTWNRLYTALPFTLQTSRACLSASKLSRIKNIFVTTWGDDGNECDIYSALPGLVYFAEHAYCDGEPRKDVLERSFLAVCGGRWEDWMKGSEVDVVDGDAEDGKGVFPPNMSKWLLWQDPMYSMYSPQHKNIQISEHYRQLKDILGKASQLNPKIYPLNSRLTFPALLSAVLELKTTLRESLVSAYKSHQHNNQQQNSSDSDHPLPDDMTEQSDDQTHQQSDPNELYAIATSTLPLLLHRTTQLWKFHRDKIWLPNFKPFGLEVLELRYGAVKTRLESLLDRVEAYLRGDVEKVEEFEVELREVFEGVGVQLVLDFARSYTPSRALGTG
ncbi:hypothetical protein HK098_005921 [Nowakowskiella sp. JEL0407]|nr:hypothetical protein HK098_005921 [Nowakowskiella sp. JEL0407]